MNFFQVKTSWANAEFIPFKLCIASAYLIAGSYFHEFFSRYYVVLFVLFGVSVIWTVALWVGKMRRAMRPGNQPS